VAERATDSSGRTWGAGRCLVDPDPLGTRARVPPYRYRPGVTATRRASGRALRDARGGLRHDELRLADRVGAAEAEKSLRRLGVDQLDLSIVHWPQRGPISARSSTARHCLRRAATAAPRSRRTAPPRHRPACLHPTVVEIAERIARTPAQVLLKLVHTAPDDRGSEALAINAAAARSDADPGTVHCLHFAD
jgi:hypothetical protein